MHPWIKTSVLAISMMTDAYEIFLMNICFAIIKEIYGEPGYASTLSSSVLIGMACGQVLFGVLADALGKKLMYICTMIILIIFSVLQAFSFEVYEGSGPYIILAIVRFILGFGIGGEYPLSSSIASEDDKWGNNVTHTLHREDDDHLSSSIMWLSIF